MAAPASPAPAPAPAPASSSPDEVVVVAESNAATVYGVSFSPRRCMYDVDESLASMNLPRLSNTVDWLQRLTTEETAAIYFHLDRVVAGGVTKASIVVRASAGGVPQLRVKEYTGDEEELSGKRTTQYLQPVQNEPGSFTWRKTPAGLTLILYPLQLGDSLTLVGIELQIERGEDVRLDARWLDESARALWNEQQQAIISGCLHYLYMVGERTYALLTTLERRLVVVAF